MMTNNNNIFNDSNPYGYKLNVNHPKVNALYNRYKKWKGHAPNEPLSDAERLDFEAYILKQKSADTVNEYPPLQAFS